MPGEVPKIPQPRDHKAQVCIWADIDVTQAETLMNATSMAAVRSILADQFMLEDHDETSSSSVLLDLYYYTVQFALDNGFNKEQLSAFFSILKKTHEVCNETPFGNLEQTYSYFKEMVLCHAVKRPPWSINLFSPDQVKIITEYILNTYFRHYKLYKYVFTPMVRLDLSISYAGMPETPVPSEAGDVNGEQSVEGEQSEEQLNKEEEQQIEEPPREETPAQKELRKLITSQLNDEISRLRTSLGEQIQLNDEVLQKKLASVDGGGAKSGKNSGKAKKK